MEKLHQILPNDTRITTAQLPVGCGIQLMVKLEGRATSEPKPAEVLANSRRWERESELAALDRYLSAIDVPLGGAGAVGPGIEALSSSGLVALAGARRAAEQQQQEAWQSWNIAKLASEKRGNAAIARQRSKATRQN